MKVIISIIFLVFSMLVYSQDSDEFKTIMKGRETGGYGAFGAGYSYIDSTDAFVYHARGGLIMNHFLSLGLGGTGFITKYEQDNNLNLSASMVGGYGGAYLEFILFGRSPIHISIPVFGGLGGAAYTTWENEGTEYARINYFEKYATYLVFEPGLELEFNLARYMRIAVYFNMRYTSDLDITNSNSSGSSVSIVNPQALNSYAAGLLFKFGKF